MRTRFGEFRFNRMEFAGALGDLGALLPISIGLIMLCGVSAIGLFFCVGAFYILGGLYYRVPIAVQPMKVIGAYALAASVSAVQISAAALLVGLILLAIGYSGLIGKLAALIPKSVVRGVQLTTGVLLMSKGAGFVIGNTVFQKIQGASEPFLAFSSIGPVSVGLILGVAGLALTLFLLNNQKIPAAMVIVFGGALCGFLLGGGSGLSQISAGLHFPDFLPAGVPGWSDLVFVMFAMVLPQIPMTLGNAVIANRDLSGDYFDKESERVTDKALCLSMGFANLASFLLGGMPMCHGAGGLAAHYRFGARTNTSNIFIGAVFLLLAVLFGDGLLPIVQLLPLGILGVLLFFAGGQLAMSIIDIKNGKDLFTAMTVLGVAQSSNLAWGFIAGIMVAYVFKSGRASI
ncbi:putative sulfate/molybdate transporter [Maridesulfovibrio bastinii]|uniref:putative sulfate/molybdate transporter n=1 Tax=Maridesulfovibrio bastinii TaxID=47157 RepID=UPI0004009546|nr:putative sulfate/molybdate transporter [Maridesulfovibrio bastinii]